MRPTEDQLRAALTKSTIPAEYGGDITIESPEEYFKVARSFIAVAYWEAQQALHDIRRLVDGLQLNPENIHAIEMILEEKCDENLQ